MDINRWRTISMHDQLLHIGAAILRAAHWQGNDRDAFLSSLREAEHLVVLTTEDVKWKELVAGLEALGEELKKFARGERQDSVAILYHAL